MMLKRAHIHWKSTFIASLVAFMGTIAVVSLIVGIYGMWLVIQTGGQPDLEAMSRFSNVFGQYAGTVGSYLATFLVGFWFARTHRQASRWNLLLLGFWMTTYGLPFFIFYPQPVLLSIRDYFVSLTLYSALALAGGITAHKTMASATLYTNLLRALSRVTSADDLIHVLSEHRPLPDLTHMALWTPDTEESGRAFSLFTAWALNPTAIPQRLTAADYPTLERVANGSSVAFRVSQLPLAEQHVWERIGVRGGVLIPIVENERDATTWNGLLFIGSAQREKIPDRVVRFYESLMPTLSLTLEKIHLLHQVSEAAVLEERQRLAREIHDTLAQGFTSIVTHLEAAESVLDTAPEVARVHLDRARRAAREGLAEARRVVWALRPDILTRTDLAEALTRVTRRWSEETGIPAHITIAGTPRPLPGDTDVVLLRAAQEALTNVRKHARATRVDVTLTYMDDRVVLDVQDNGVGFDPATLESSDGFGLHGMRERVEARGGELVVESAPGEGTTVVVSIKLGISRVTPSTT